MEQTVPSSKPKDYRPGETKAQRKARKRLEKQKMEQPAEDLLAASLASKNYVACLKWGDKYSAEYVNRLYSMVDRHITIDYEFICFTEDDKNLNKNIKVLPLPKIQAKGWWYKPMFVGAELPLNGTLLFLDLDVVIFENIDKLFSYEPNEFVICRDFNRSIRQRWDRMNSSVFRTPIGKYDDIWKQFKKDIHNQTSKFRGDQDWMYKNIKDHKFWPDEWIMSYKWEMRDRRDLKINSVTRKRNFIVDAPPKIHKDTSIAVFHGDPNPSEANDTWVKKHWG